MSASAAATATTTGDAGTAPSPFTVILFYNYKRIDAQAVVDAAKPLCERLGLTGRLLVANEGVNGTLSGTEDAIAAFVEALRTGRDAGADGAALPWGELLAETDIKRSLSDVEPFPDLKVSVVKEVVSTGGVIPDRFDMAGTHLPPAEFHAALSKAIESGALRADAEAPVAVKRAREDDEEAAAAGAGAGAGSDAGASASAGAGSAKGSRSDVVLLDVRNGCEYDIGHFSAATKIPTRTFAEMPKWVDDNVELVRDKTVFMYCTGGIRCEKGSAFLRSRGAKEVYQLQGGIHRYLEAFPDGGLFQGRNFVFDKRVALSAEKPKVPVVGRCAYCAALFDEYAPDVVCAVCRDLVLCCTACRAAPERRGEYHCAAHWHLRGMYYAVLDGFSVPELAKQRADLEAHMAADLQGHEHKNRRRTITRQVARLSERIAQLEAGTASAAAAPMPKTPWTSAAHAAASQSGASEAGTAAPAAGAGTGAGAGAGAVSGPARCRSCGRESCDGQCWGFWAKGGAKPSGVSSAAGTAS